MVRLASRRSHVRALAQAPTGDGQGRGGGRGRGRGANIPAEKLARVSLMTLNFDSAGLLKLPWTANPRPTQTIDILDLPQYDMDQYRVPNMEFQADHLAQESRDRAAGSGFLQAGAREDWTPPESPLRRSISRSAAWAT